MRRALPLLAATLLSNGCLMAGNYHSAKTLEKGTSSFGMTFSMTTYEFEDPGDGSTRRFTLPNLIPEIAYHVGITDDVEAGGRVALGSLGLEADLKYRFLHSDKLHLAVAPAIGYQAFVVIQGTSLKLPVLLTHELSDNFAFNAGLFWLTTRYSEVDNSDEEFEQFRGTLGATGLSLSFDLAIETFVIRPGVEFTQYLNDFEDDGDFQKFSTVNVMVHIAWIGGKEKKQLNRIERKIDSIRGPDAPPIEDDSPYRPGEEPIK